MLTFNVEDVREAYAVTGLKPKTGCWVKKEDNCACALGALLALNLGTELPTSFGYVTAAKELFNMTEDEVTDFIGGFDYGSADTYSSPARKLGVACRKEFLKTA